VADQDQQDTDNQSAGQSQPDTVKPEGTGQQTVHDNEGHDWTYLAKKGAPEPQVRLPNHRSGED